MKIQQKYGVSETSFLFAYTAGYNSAYNKNTNPYKKDSILRKIWLKGKREAKKFY